MEGKSLNQGRRCQRSTRIWLSLGLLWISVFGCTAQQPPPPPPPPPPAVSPPPEPEKIKLIVLRLENKTRKGKKDNSSGEDRLFGGGVRKQIVDALEQSGRFIIQENDGERKFLSSDTVTNAGAIQRAVLDRLGSLGDAEFLVAGALQLYQLSQESKNAGIDADLLFRESQANTVNVDGIVNTAKRIFTNLKPKDTDLVDMDLWLFDARTGRRIASTNIQGIPSDFSAASGGKFGQQLVAVSGELKTPMQQALRGGAIEAVHWIEEKGEQFRKEPKFEPTVPKPQRTPRPTTTKKSDDTEKPPGSTAPTDAAEPPKEGSANQPPVSPDPGSSSPPPSQGGNPPSKKQWGQ